MSAKANSTQGAGRRPASGRAVSTMLIIAGMTVLGAVLGLVVAGNVGGHGATHLAGAAVGAAACAVAGYLLAR